MGRTLYLTETDQFKAKADGPSILINWSNRSDQRIPLRLISRCIIVGNVQLESAVISLLASHNIPIIFTNASGYELAIALPYNHRLPRRWKEQRIFMETKKNRERFIRWAKLKRMNLQLNLLKKLFPKKSYQFNRDIGEGNYQELLSFFKPKEEIKWKIVKGFIENLFRTIIIEKLNQSGLNLDAGIIHRYNNFGLLLDFGYILEPLIDEQAIQFFKHSRDVSLFDKKERIFSLNKEGLKEVIHRFENKKELIEETMENALDEYFQLMRELIK